jgi:UDP-N-acetylmuramoyl-L-alanyl-D-glutamate--2,6-diaminopimelate ligase
MATSKAFSVERLHQLNVPVTRLVNDSRAVVQGDTFIAYPGEKLDGRQFIAQAIERGANAVIWESHNFAWEAAWQVPNLAVDDLRHQAGRLADAVYGQPSEQLRVIGITGTNGKTSTSHWIAHALEVAGQRCALIGTLGCGLLDGSSLQASANTTPDALRVQGLLAGYLRDGARAVAMEVSSHALAQGRVNGVRFDVALLTNLSRDHLDYHGDRESYAASKRKLFDWESLRCVVLNLDDAFGAGLADELCGGAASSVAEVIGYGISDAALQLAERLGIRMVYGRLTEVSARGLGIDIHSSWGAAQLRSGLVGRFNAANLLGALAVLLVSDITLAEAVHSLGKVQAVAGRMQRLGSVQQPAVSVDYAHTPDALEMVLLTLREVNDSSGGKLICVFGCGGDRDRGKRAMMGVVAEKFSDHCIITSDNPRSEDPQRIIAEVVGGMTASNHEIIVDRAAAIERAIGLAQQRDTVLLAGKGHEDYQEIGGVKHPFSDVLVAQRVLQTWRSEACA